MSSDGAALKGTQATTAEFESVSFSATMLRTSALQLWNPLFLSSPEALLLPSFSA